MPVRSRLLCQLFLSGQSVIYSVDYRVISVCAYVHQSHEISTTSPYLCKNMHDMRVCTFINAYCALTLKKEYSNIYNVYGIRYLFQGIGSCTDILSLLVLFI